MYEDEIWRDVVGYEGLYQISSYGRLMSLHKQSNRLLKGKYDKDGYVEYALCRNGKVKYRRSHRLVAEMFIPNTEDKPMVNHINGIKDDNRVDNLEWCTNRDNTIHAWNTGLNENSREVASYTHGKQCKLIKITDGSEIKFNSLSKTSEFLGKSKNWLKHVLRKKNYEQDLFILGYYIEVEEKRTYERITEES